MAARWADAAKQHGGDAGKGSTADADADERVFLRHPRNTSGNRPRSDDLAEVVAHRSGVGACHTLRAKCLRVCALDHASVA